MEEKGRKRKPERRLLRRSRWELRLTEAWAKVVVMEMEKILVAMVVEVMVGNDAAVLCGSE